MNRVSVAALGVVCWCVHAGVASGAALRVTSVRPIYAPVTLSGCADSKAENTPQVAVDPRDSRHLAVTYAIGDGSASVLAQSRDAGATWEARPIAGTLKCDGGGGRYVQRFDPDLGFAPDGRLYVSESVYDGSQASGTAAADALISTQPPGGALSAPVSVLPSDPMMISQRALLAFDGTAPGFAYVLAERMPYLGTYLPLEGSLWLAATQDGGASFGSRAIYTAPPGSSVVGEGLLLHGRTVLAFGEQVAATESLPALAGGTDLPEQAIVLRSSDGGETFSPAQTVARHLLGTGVANCCLFRPAVAPDGTFYWPIAAGGALTVYRSTDDGRSWKALRAAHYDGGVSEPQMTVDSAGRVALSLYRLSAGGKTAEAHVLVSGTRGDSWRDITVGSPFAISALGPVDDASPLGPVQGIAATPRGFVAAMTVGGGNLAAGGTSDVDLISLKRVKPRPARPSRGRAPSTHPAPR